VASLKEIYEIVKINNEKLDSLLQWKAGHNEQHKIINRDLNEIRETLFDNPGGLKSRVERLWNCKNTITTWREFFLQILRTVITWAVIALVIWQLFIYKQH